MAAYCWFYGYHASERNLRSTMDHGHTFRLGLFIHIAATTDQLAAMAKIKPKSQYINEQRLLYYEYFPSNGPTVPLFGDFNIQCFDAVGWAAGRASGL